MKHFIVLLLILTIFFIGCTKKSENVNTEHNSVQENNTDDKNITEMKDLSVVFENTVEENEAIINMINNDSNPYKVIDLERINFGVPNGENWLVTLQSERFDGTLMENISLFLIKDNKIKKEYFLGSNDNFKKYTQYNIMKDIPGMHMGSGPSAYGDYNGDGVIELFQYGFGGNGWFVNIKGYDADTNKITNYCGSPGIPFGIIDPVNGPAPVQFMTYNGRYGFKVYIEVVTVAGGRDYVSEPMPYNNKWFFYSWDETQKMYVEMGEVFE